MSFLVLHLSDLHFSSSNERVFSRTDDIAASVASVSQSCDELLVAISGDVANAGLPAEYDVALQFLKDLQGAIHAKTSISIIQIVAVPGNHDLDLTRGDPIRDLVLGQKPGVNLERKLLEVCLQSQKPFYDFLGKASAPAMPNDAVHHVHRLEWQDGPIHVHLLNTAWCSRRQEKQSELWMPVLELPAPFGSAAVSLAIFHHPYCWLAADNARSYRRAVEECSDFVLTGHEHDGDSYSRQSHHHHASEYFEGYLLNNRRDDSSGFHVIKVEPRAKRFDAFAFHWKENGYALANKSLGVPFKSHSKHLSDRFHLTDAFAASLEDPGASFTHPHVPTLTLSHIFVDPDLRDVTPKEVGKTASNNTVIDGGRSISTVLENERTLITGIEKSGRSALSKQLFKRARQLAMLPLLINGAQLRSEKETLRGALESELLELYKDIQWVEVCKLDKAERLLIIDDFHNIPGNIRRKSTLLSEARDFFGKIIVLADDIVRLEDLSASSRQGTLFEAFKQYQIPQFGYLQRDRLIERWIVLGQESILDDNFIDTKRKQYAHAVDLVLGKNLVPAYPIFILVLLQQLEAGMPSKTTSGSFGYFFECLVTKALATATTINNVDLKYNYLSELAKWLFDRNTNTLTELEFFNFNEYYNNRYQLKLSAEAIARDLVRANILEQPSSGELRIRYKYCYYYFLALWLTHNIHDQETRLLIQQIVSKIHTEDCANIVVFLTYLCKDPFVLDTVVELASTLYPDVSPCDLDRDTAYLNELQNRVPELVYVETDAKTSRQYLLKHRDDQEHTAEDTAKDEKALEDILLVNRAFKTMEIIGQVLKNYSGSLRREQKMRLAEQCITVGLRTMNFFMQMIGNNIDGLVSYLVECYDGDREIITQAEITDKARRFIFGITNMWAVGVIRKISFAVGAQQLEVTYKELFDQSPTHAKNLIDIAIKLDHFNRFPEKEILTLRGDTYKNIFTSSALNRLVLAHFYMFSVDHRIRERICTELGIKVDKAKLLNQRSKKMSA